MSAGKRKIATGKTGVSASREIELSGKVVVKKYAAGSKSAHDAVFLETANESYVLRKIGGNPFFDSSLHELEGKTVKVRGLVNDKLILAREVTEHAGRGKQGAS